MRVLIVTARYLPHRGGLETVVCEVSRQMRLGGHTVTIITNRYPHTLPEHDELDGVPVRRLRFLFTRLTYLKSLRPDLWLAGLIFFPLTLFQLAASILSFRPDLVNLHYLGSPGIFIWLLQRLFRFRLVVSLHGGDVDGEPHQSRFNRWLFNAVLDRAEKVTTCSQILLDQALNLAPEIAPKAQVIHNGVDAKLFTNATVYNHSQPYLFAVGQLVYHKGFDTLISAFALISEQIPGVDLLIAGDGYEKEALRVQIQGEGMNGRMKLLGSVNREQVAALMRGSLAVVIPSRREPFGIVGLEAMASGRPIIAAQVGGLTEALAEANVIWVPVDDPDSLGAALRTLFTDHPRRRQAIKANQIYAQAYSWKRVSDKYLEVFTVDENQMQNETL